MVNDRFTQLLTKKLTDDLDPQEQEEFAYLLDESEFNKQQYQFFKAYWVQDEEEYSNSHLMFNKIRNKITLPEAVISGKEEPKARNLHVYLKAMAAVLVIAIGISAMMYLPKKEQQLQAKLKTTETISREKCKVTLADGTTVMLNSKTSLKYPLEFNGKNREVYLNGEAFFDVKKDHQHPFIVHAGKMSIKVLGTAFNIRSYANDVSTETTLIRGAIEVTLTDRPSDRIILKPNEKLVLRNVATESETKFKRRAAITRHRLSSSYALTSLTYLRPNDSTVVETSWVNNKLVFKDEEFKDIANKMERWYGIDIKFKSSNKKGYRFTGMFERETVSQALKALQMIEPFTFKVDDDTVYIY